MQLCKLPLELGGLIYPTKQLANDGGCYIAAPVHCNIITTVATMPVQSVSVPRSQSLLVKLLPDITVVGIHHLVKDVWTNNYDVSGSAVPGERS